MSEQAYKQIAIAVIEKDGQILISKRAEQVHLGGLWEFPGGKVESNETLEHALQREIHEELGIRVDNMHPMMQIKHHYDEFNIQLNVFHVNDFSGVDYHLTDATQLGLEDQQVKWVDKQTLANYSFPKANQAILTALNLPDSYLISPNIIDETELSELSEYLSCLSKLSKYHSLIQLRLKNFNSLLIDDVLGKMLERTLLNDNKVMLNSSMIVSKPLYEKCSGIHLTSKHLFDSDYIATLKQHYPDKLLSASCHQEADIQRANECELDFIVISPVKVTRSHPQQAALGWPKFSQLTAMARMPVYALGGMSPIDIEHSQSLGAQGISAIRSLWCDN